MTTIFTSKIEELPPTSDMKMIDIWLIFCLVVPFTEVILRTVIECINCSCHICVSIDANEAKAEKEGKKEGGDAIQEASSGEVTRVWEQNLEVAGGKCWRRKWLSALNFTGETFNLFPKVLFATVKLRNQPGNIARQHCRLIICSYFDFDKY